MENFVPTERTQVHRLAKRGVYDREAVYRILDEGLVCHVGFVADGKPVVIPTGYGRKDDTLYVHGSIASRMLKASGKRRRCVHHRHPARRAGAGAVGLSSLHELPVRGHLR